MVHNSRTQIRRYSDGSETLEEDVEIGSPQGSLRNRLLLLVALICSAIIMVIQVAKIESLPDSAWSNLRQYYYYEMQPTWKIQCRRVAFL